MSVSCGRLPLPAIPLALATCAGTEEADPSNPDDDTPEPPSAPQPTHPDAPGPYAVGVDTLQFTDPRVAWLRRD